MLLKIKIKFLFTKWFARKHNGTYCPHFCKLCVYNDVCTNYEEFKDRYIIDHL